ncbi:Glycosyl transferase family 2 [Pedobacter terrae]|uniref:Glycosyl transferase family 2 n=1 Tax=Pedobacter terrae TaxID=405671 RepID=A0A1G7NZB8_9SPHI|nr:glycosyltransferase family A protein [Pedobacter terrae]SDF79324.1 Glycosyl transferase family 2 [Pedobacter terrae]
MMSDIKISFCTTCMNRLFYLRQTLPKNLFDNKDYKNLEFVILDYNSSDELEKYIRDSYQDELYNGRIVYYRIDSVQFYDWAHSRNLVASLATGDVICNIDADNFTGPGFAQYVNEVFQNRTDVFMTTYYISQGRNDVLGRICMMKDNFMKIGGYDERMKHYGFEDIDLICRLGRSGLHKIDIANPLFLRAIPHSNKERMLNSKEGFYLIDFFIRYINAYTSELLFLFQDGTTKSATMINNFVYNSLERKINSNSLQHYHFSILEKSWVNGQWAGSEQDQLTQHPGFYKIESETLREEALFFFHQLSNRLIMDENTKKGLIKVKNKRIHKGNLFKNFSSLPHQPNNQI